MTEEKQKIVEHIMQHQSDFPTREVCGFIVERDGGLHCWPLSNIANDEDFFVLDPRETYEIYIAMNPRAVYHTHVKGDTTPSELDKQTCELTCLPMWIVDQKGNLNIYDQD